MKNRESSKREKTSRVVRDDMVQWYKDMNLYKSLSRLYPNPGPPKPVNVPVVGKVPYDLGKTLGSGSAGKVVVCRKAATRFKRSPALKYAAKICLVESEKERKARVEETLARTIARKGLSTDENDFELVELELEGMGQGGATDAKQTRVPREDLMSELKALSHLQSKYNPHVIKLIDSFETIDEEHGSRLWIITERLTLSLEHVFEKAVYYDDPVSLEVVAYLGQEIAHALLFLKQHRVVHLDLKPANILLSITGKVKLCDFGLAVIIPEGQTSLTVEQVRGTIEFMASELLEEGNEFDYQADLWALAVVLSNLATNATIPCGFIHDDSWNDYAESNVKYFYHMLGATFLSKEEHSSCRKVTSKTGIRIAEESAKKYESWRDFAHLIRGCLIPLPARGPSNMVKRAELLSRSSLTHVLSWTSTVLQNYCELTLQQSMLRYIKGASNVVIGGSQKVSI